MCMTKARYVILWLMVVLYGLLLCSCNHSEKAFTVNGLAVEKAELVHYMQENTAVVAAALEEEAGVDSFHDDFWLVPQNGVDTFSRLREYTTQQIVRQKVEQLCAKEQGIDTPLYYSDQLTEMKEQNRQRTSAYETGEVLYGPVERDFVTYFSEWYLDMKKQCRRCSAKKEPFRLLRERLKLIMKLIGKILPPKVEKTHTIVSGSICWTKRMRSILTHWQNRRK